MLFMTICTVCMVQKLGMRNSLSITTAFSWHELGLHDLPAMVDYVLEHSGHEDLHYIGHSMGSTGMMVLLSSSPEYNRKIRLASFLAPVAYVSQIRSRLFRHLASIAGKIKASTISFDRHFDHGHGSCHSQTVKIYFENFSKSHRKL